MTPVEPVGALHSDEEAPARVGVDTRTVPVLVVGQNCPPRALGVTANNGACPKLVTNFPRGALAFVETVYSQYSGRSVRRSAKPSRHRPRSRRAVTGGLALSINRHNAVLHVRLV